MFYLTKSRQFVHCNANTLKTDPGSVCVGGGGGEGAKYKKHGKHSSEILKKNFRRYQGHVQWAWLELFSPLRGKKVKCAYEIIVAHQAGA